MARAKVVTIAGLPIASPGHPDRDVVMELQELLKRARAGEIVAVAMAYNNADLSTGWLMAGNCNNTIRLVGELERVKARTLASIDG